MDGRTVRFWREREADGRILAVVTLVTFGGGFLVFDFRPFGPHLAAALMLIWLAVAVATAIRQHRFDSATRPTVGVEAKRQPWQLAVQWAAVLIPLAAFLYALWLSSRAAATETVASYKSIAFGLLLLGQVAAFLTDWAAERSRRRRPEGPTPQL